MKLNKPDALLSKWQIIFDPVLKFDNALTKKIFLDLHHRCFSSW